MRSGAAPPSQQAAKQDEVTLVSAAAAASYVVTYTASGEKVRYSSLETVGIQATLQKLHQQKLCTYHSSLFTHSSRHSSLFTHSSRHSSLFTHSSRLKLRSLKLTQILEIG
jgi:hypothetical protein